MWTTYKVDEGHVEAEVAEQVADVPEHDLGALPDVGQRAVAAHRRTACGTWPGRPDAVIVVVVRLAVIPPSSTPVLQLTGGGILARREVPAAQDPGDKHQAGRAAKGDAEVEVRQQPRVDRVKQKTSWRTATDSFRVWTVSKFSANIYPSTKNACSYRDHNANSSPSIAPETCVYALYKCMFDCLKFDMVCK